MYKRGFPMRCRKCLHRRTLRMKIEWYIRKPPSCPCGGPYRPDNYRLKKEHYKHPRCECHGYGFPHRPKSKWCIHNPALPDEHDIARRYGTNNFGNEDDDVCPF